MSVEDIKGHHRARLACVYIRQSSPRQVVAHQESQRRQRALARRAVELGWPADRVLEVDQDLGVSASRSQRRLGFDELVAQTALGKVGLILALEVSRLSRSNRDWYHLMDVCAVTRTLIADTEGIYDPRRYLDRAHLGLKGVLSEGEYWAMRERLTGAIRSKAARGEFRMRLPPGFVWNEGGEVVKDPDEEVRTVIELILQRFDELGTVHQVLGSLLEEGIRVPVQQECWHQFRWQRPDYRYVHSVLTQPAYGGAYAFGRTQTEEILDASQRPAKRRRKVPAEQWHSLIPDHHEGYISWESFQRNQERIRSNRRRGTGAGAPGKGSALLQGLVLCGRCGRRMKVAYGRAPGRLRYRCVQRQKGNVVCQSFGGLRLERAVEGLLLECLEPLGVEAMIRAAASAAEAIEAERAYWEGRVERAQYEAELARRAYDAVDPENRLVARELERRFEKALEKLEAVQAEANARIAALDRPLSPQEQERLRRYATDLPSLWRAPTTRMEDRKRIARLLIRSVVVTVPKEGTTLRAEVHWNGGEKTAIEVRKGKSGVSRYAAEPELVELIRQLAPEFSDSQIARILHRRRLKTPKGLTFTAHRVANLRHSHGIPASPWVHRKKSELLTAEEAADLLGVHHSTVIRWVEVGLLRGSQVTRGAPWRIQLTEDDVGRLKATDAPPGWLPLKGAARELGVSQQTVLQRLKAGELEGVRVRVGRRVGWRIRVPKRARSQQPSLFQ